MKTKTVTIPKLKARLQTLFNAYIRQRDEGQPCISCGQFKTLQAGHYYSVRMYDGLRFHEDNCHGECCGCNGFDDMHLVHYTENLRRKIGEERFNDLSVRAKNYKMDGYKWTRSELEELIKEYTEKLKKF